MLNLPQQALNKIKQKLLRQQKEVDEQLKDLQVNDAIKEEAVPEASEPGTDSWLAEIHNQMVAVSRNLGELSGRIKQALMNIRRGRYGHCEKCGKHIEAERLEAMPAANLCLTCSKKPTKK